MSVFWFAKGGSKAGIYSIGLGNIEVAVITAGTDEQAAQWAQVCTRALNEHERKLRRLAEELDPE